MLDAASSLPSPSPLLADFSPQESAFSKPLSLGTVLKKKRPFSVKTVKSKQETIHAALCVEYTLIAMGTLTALLALFTMMNAAP